MFITELQQVQPQFFEVCGRLREIYIGFRLSRGCTLPQWWLVTPYLDCILWRLCILSSS